MYEGDIKLDGEGNTIIRDGDFVLTDTDKEFIVRMLLSTPGSWKLHPQLGIGLQDFVGEQNTEDTLNKMRTKIISFFREYNMYPVVSVLPIDDESAICDIEFFVPGESESIPLTSLCSAKRTD